ncbi:2-phosphoxylose phosphatase 1-like [Actinia tenebrosa]|uniref:2-phosphoxylose phosphatase 1 n=1 Tax=Actinia tenebrosa TaxID=6105 RepID=A0A6P8HHH4_ACTTE|nr:2-phosphoxylose phosphatase 1-like [Actinia tenebrosa]
MIPSTVVCVRRMVCSYIRITRARFATLTKQQQLLVAIAFIFILLVYFGYFNLSKRIYISVLPVDRRSVQKYCNFPVNSNGAEGSIPGRDGDFQLEMVQVLLRHGDRAPFSKIQGMEIRDLDCSMTPLNDTVKKLFDGYLNVIEDIIVRRMSSKVVPHNLVTRSEICQYDGQLTKKGFQQLFHIGRHFKTAYSKLIENGINNNHVYARSTNTDRTLQSAAALLYGFLGEKSIKKGHIAISISQDRFFRDNDDGTVSPCPAYEKLMERTKQSKEYQSGSAAMEPLMLEMSNLLMAPRESIKNVIGLADACLVHICHGLPSPCTVGGCIPQATAFKLISYADWAFSHNYSQVADMISLPVMSQIASRMVDKASSKTPVKFAIYGGHEISIIPALMSLGIFEQRWIPYASRLIFEFWKKTGVINETKKNQRGYIRVLYNGETVTSNLKFCKKNLFENGELCPLEDFLRWLGGGRIEEPQKSIQQQKSKCMTEQ